VYDVALSEGIDPGLAFRLVKVESGFNPRAMSHVGAVGLTQVLPSTARLYEPGLTTQQLYDRDTNLRIGFRYLRDLLDRYPANMRLALLAYSRGPAEVEQLLGAGRNPANGYETEVMKGFRHHYPRVPGGPGRGGGPGLGLGATGSESARHHRAGSHSASSNHSLLAAPSARSRADGRCRQRSRRGLRDGECHPRC